MTSNIRLLKSAERDIAEAMSWYREQEADLELEFLAEVDATMRRIAIHPSGYRTRFKSYRAALVRRFPYTVYYRQFGDELRVTAVLHQRRGPTIMRKRLL
jgi:plasmid stabilization system protein ParE